MNVTWSTTTSTRPWASGHIPTVTYTWRVWVFDGGQSDLDSVTFTY